MKLDGNGRLLRVFIGEADMLNHRPLYEAIVLKARELGLAGATVLKGVQGYGADSRVIHTAKILRLSEDLPIVVEMVDTEEKIKSFITVVGDLLEQAGCGGMITDELAHIVQYKTGK